jgi:hypothetical protein
VASSSENTEQVHKLPLVSPGRRVHLQPLALHQVEAPDLDRERDALSAATGEVIGRGIWKVYDLTWL